MANISPGVYTKIIDLSTYVQAVPGTIGFFVALAEKGQDNVFKFIGSRSELIGEYGEPKIETYGQSYGQGLYCAYNYLGESGAMYFTRPLPDNATFANIRIDASYAAVDATASVVISYNDSLNSELEITTNLEAVGDTYPLCFIYPIGRGQWYNNLAIRIVEISNPLLNDVYVMDIYEKQSDGDDVIVESFEISFRPEAQDDTGSSMFIMDVLNTYSTLLRADMVRANGEWTEGYDILSRRYDKDIGTVTIVETAGLATITDNKQVFSDWENAAETGNSTFMVVAKDARGNQLYGWLGAAGGAEDDTVNVFDARNLTGASQSWVGDMSAFDEVSLITYEIRQSNTSVATAFTSAEPVPLKYGSEGDLINATGDLDTAEATTLLAQAYAGALTSTVDGSSQVDDVLDTENIYISAVFDSGYPNSVKQQISSLCQTRRDCVGILDNGDNPTFNSAISERTDVNTFNNYFVALYESYNKVFDIFTGRDVWFSPMYHMSYLLPRSDALTEVWFAIAGFNRASIDTIKELRYNPKLGQRDQMYLKQLNPIVKFNPGYVVWGQLTSQAKASALQDLNIVRLVLYVKRALEEYCRFFIFEQNDQLTWSQVSGDIVLFLEDIRKRRGLYNFNVDVGATEYERKRKTFHVNIMLEPTRVVEKIELNFFIV